MNDAERLEIVEKSIDALIMMNESVPIIVEGEKDEASLRKIGIKGKVLRLNKGVSIFNFCEEVAERFDEVIILTDWDAKGGRLSKLLRDCLKANGVSYNTQFRSELARHCIKEIKDVESLATYIEKKRAVHRQ